MTPKNIKTHAVEKSDYRVYMRKAKDFYDIMLKALELENWTAAGLNAVHCAISACDTVLVFHLGIRSVSDDHMEVANLLLRLPKEIIEGEVPMFKRIVAKKNLIAYENRDFRQNEAIEITKMADRFYNRAISKLPV